MDCFDSTAKTECSLNAFASPVTPVRPGIVLHRVLGGLWRPLAPRLSCRAGPGLGGDPLAKAASGAATASVTVPESRAASSASGPASSLNLTLRSRCGNGISIPSALSRSKMRTRSSVRAERTAEHVGQMRLHFEIQRRIAENRQNRSPAGDSSGRVHSCRQLRRGSGSPFADPRCSSSRSAHRPAPGCCDASSCRPVR